MIRLRYPKVALLVLGVLTVVQCLFLPIKVRPLPTASFSESVYDLGAIGPLRFGYAPGQHGATLAVSSLSSKPKQPVAPYESELAGLMRRELALIPVKFVFEVLFYFAILSAGVAVLRFWSRRTNAKLLGRALHTAIVACGSLSLLALPVALFGYDASLFTTWEGPGAFSSSGPYMEQLSGRLGQAVSYRMLLEIVALAALRVPYVTAVLHPMSWWVFFAVVVPAALFMPILLGAVATEFIQESWSKRTAPGA